MVDHDAPTIGVYLRRPDVVERRRLSRWRAHMRLADRQTRTSVAMQLGDIQYSVMRGRRLDVVAQQLRELADRCDATPQPFDAEHRTTVRDAT